jgi:hypothetical protein
MHVQVVLLLHLSKTAFHLHIWGTTKVMTPLGLPAAISMEVSFDIQKDISSPELSVGEPPQYVIVGLSVKASNGLG